MKKIEQILKALANSRRLEIIKFLEFGKRRDATVGDIAEEIKLSFKSTSRHLSVLYKAEILDREQKSLEVHYRLATNKHPIIKHLLTIL